MYSARAPEYLNTNVSLYVTSVWRCLSWVLRLNNEALMPITLLGMDGEKKKKKVNLFVDLL